MERNCMVLASSQMSIVGGVFVPSATAWAAGERCGVAASAQSPISSVSGEDTLDSVLRTNAVDRGWENSWTLVAS